jgi:predicted GH43/DUF377 family glycosyl hydrolase
MVPVRRFKENPLLTPKDIVPSTPGVRVLGAFNPGAFVWNYEMCLLVRVSEAPIPPDLDTVIAPYFDFASGQRELKSWAFSRKDPAYDFSDTRLVKSRDRTWITSASHLRIARSKDGIHFKVDEKPTLWPANEYENLGIEDPRVVFLEDRYLITFSAISRDHGVCSNLVTTQDWKTFEHRGVLFVPDNKDICIFPERVGGQYIALHRPSVSMLGMPNLWIAESDDLIHWGRHECLLKVRPGKWDSARIGCGPAPILTDEGWLAFYHGSDNTNYYMGAALLDRDDPYKVIARSEDPIYQPVEPYEKKGFFANVVFCNGLIESWGGRVFLYYGAADMCCAAVEVRAKDVLDDLLKR